MSELTAQITELRDLNKKYLRSAIRSSQATLAGPRDNAGLYNATGTSGGTATGARLFDQRVRSAERRVGKEGEVTCRYRGWAYDYQQHNKKEKDRQIRKE